MENKTHLLKVIKSRRSIMPNQYNDLNVSDEEINLIYTTEINNKIHYCYKKILPERFFLFIGYFRYLTDQIGIFYILMI